VKQVGQVFDLTTNRTVGGGQVEDPTRSGPARDTFTAQLGIARDDAGGIVATDYSRRACPFGSALSRLFG
jgi:hypothetical protein